MTIETPAWVRDAVFYQILPDRFAISERVPKAGRLEPWDAPPTNLGFKGGDLLGIAERLPYLVDLGVTALYLTPIFSSASNHRYHTYDYLTVDPLLGGTAAFRELLDAAHAQGVRVVLDGVFNHTGRGFWPFHHLLEAGAASPYRDWFHVDVAALEAGRPLRAYPSSAERDLAPDEPELAGVEGLGRRHLSSSLRRFGYQAWWDLPALPKLNTDTPAVREYLFGVAEHWLRFGIDGWRLDVPTEIDDLAFWREFRTRCRAVNPEAYLVGEIWHPAPEWLSGDRFDAVMNYPLATAILGYVAGRHLDWSVVQFHDEYRRQTRALDGAGFAAALEATLERYDPAVTAVQLNLLDSHDTPRFLTLCSGDRDAYRLAVLLQATLPGAPCIYYGDEIGLEGGPDPDCRRSFPTDPARWDSALHAYVRAAFALRAAHRVLRHGRYRTATVSGAGFAFVREAGGLGDCGEDSGPGGGEDGGRAVVVALNAGEETVELVVPVAGDGRRFEAVSLPGWPPARADETFVVAGSALELRLPPRQGIVLVAADGGADDRPAGAAVAPVR